MVAIRAFVVGLGIVSLAIAGVMMGEFVGPVFRLPAPASAIISAFLLAVAGAAAFVTWKPRPRGVLLVMGIVGGCAVLAPWLALEGWQHAPYTVALRGFAGLLGTFPSLVSLPRGEMAALRSHIIASPQTSAERRAAQRLHAADRAGTIATFIIIATVVATIFFFGVFSYALGLLGFCVVSAFVAQHERSILSDATTAFFRASA